MLNRLVGLETEYAIRFHPDHPQIDEAADYQHYHALVHTLSQRVPTVPASDLKEGVFFGPGGAVWFERVRFAGGTGLVEGSTPECRGPREAVTYQRAQDLLLSEAARDTDSPGVLALIKNDCDSQGHIYGAQENYELTLAAGWRLRLWRWGLVALLPLMLLAWLGHAVLILGLVIYLLAAAILYLLLLPFLKPDWRRPVQAALLGDELSGRVAYSSPVPEWVEAAALGYIRVAAAPLALGLYLLARMTNFCQIRRELTGFLMSRPIIGGAGFIDPSGAFQLSDKAWGMNCLLGFNGIVFDRPIYSIGHFFKSLMFRVWCSPVELSRLMSPRQRLQICLGDSNMAEEAEYLRVGTTMLVLDAIEAGYLSSVPKVKRPIKSLRTLCADPTLQTAVPCRDGQSRTAIAIQRLYYEACARFVSESGEATNEAKDILERWDEVLTLLETNPDELIGRLDWVTKQFLLRQAADDDADAAVKKKIDIRYHELTPDGYYRRLESTGVTRSVLFTEEIERATKIPPKATPATIRSRFMRDLANRNRGLRVNWDTIIIGRGWKARRIAISDLEPPIDDFPRDPAAAQKARPQEPDNQDPR